ncbi:switch-associated protein 70-like [Neocloeon triangulifer]|uniref:switch-associated protein 70-like n=1 Tax=Neocloeon triangulifer TaxID=2078957 RepID=UPI00286F4A23|nr:switch-associated protein 70-like [Neocloeon triangulifer]
MSLLCFNSTKRRSSSMDAEESVTKNEIPEGMRPEAKIAGYLDKRGRRLPTWKRYWFVLDGPLLLYFQSEEDYLNLSPCKGSLNIGLVVSVRPSGSRSSPQLILVTRAHPVHLRAKESKDQERWLKGLLDSIVQFSRAAEPSMVNSLRRYEDACLPEQPEVVSTMERVRRMGQQALMPPDQLLNASKSLRKVAPSIPSQANNNDDSVCAITAKLPTNSAVHRMLEKRQEDKKVEEEEQKEQSKKSSEEEVKKEAETGLKENQEENKKEKSECENKKEESTVEINEEIAEKKEDVVKTVAEVVKVPVEYSVVVKDRKSKIDPIQKPEEKPKEDVKEPAPSVKVEDVEDEDAGYDLINKDYQIEGDYEAIEQSEEEDIYAMPSADEEKDEAEDEPVVPPRPQQETFHATPVVILESSPEPDYEYSETMFSVEWTEPEPPPRPIEIHNQVERTFSADELDVLLSKTSSEVAPIMTRLSLDP